MISFFGCHPTKVRAEQFWDFNFYEGANPPRDSLLPPKLRPAETMETAQKNFKRLMQFLKDQENIEITTISDLMEKFSYQPESISSKDLERIARKTLAEGRIVYDAHYAPAEVFAALSKSLLDYKQTGKIPRKLQRESPLGPMALPEEAPGISQVSGDQLYELAGAARDIMRNQGHLPSELLLDGYRIGTGSLMQLFSSAYLDMEGNKEQDSYEVIPFDGYPKEYEDEIIGAVHDAKHWIVHRTDLDMSHLADMTRMQLWTLKPAIEK
jgi:hypothetical protein